MTDRLLNIQVSTPQKMPVERSSAAADVNHHPYRLDASSSCPEAKGLPSCSSCEYSSPEAERFKVTILGVAVGNYMKMHYSDLGWYIGSI